MLALRPFHIIREYLKWRGRWDELCARCGLCCYARTVLPPDEVIVELSAPCKYLDGDTHLCSVYENRFRTNPRCRRIHLGKVLFNRSMPPGCAYVRTFRTTKR